jgi:hypothetical protein
MHVPTTKLRNFPRLCLPEEHNFICHSFYDTALSRKRWNGQTDIRLAIIYTDNHSCRPRRSSGGLTLASHRGGPGSSPGQVMWDLLWAKWRWCRFSPSTSVSSTNSHSTDCFTFIIIYHPGLV